MLLNGVSQGAGQGVDPPPHLPPPTSQTSKHDNIPAGSGIQMKQEVPRRERRQLASALGLMLATAGSIFENVPPIPAEFRSASFKN